MTTQRSSLLINIFALFSIGLTAALLLYLSWNTDRLAKAAHNRFYCNILAAEFRTHSDELTRQAQLYAVTGEKSAVDAYDHVLDVLRGETPRPAKALVAPGEKRVFLELMKEYGITNEEFSLVDSANNISENLVVLEVEAQNAVQGIFKDAKGEYTVHGEPDMELARSLVFSEAYWNEVSKIKVEIDKFQAKVNERTDRAIHRAEKSQRGTQFIYFAALALATVLSTILVSIDKAKRKADLENRQKSDFLATVSHEIRTPMNAIMGITEMQLNEENLPEKLRESFNLIHYSGDLLLSIINDLLDLSKIESGKLEINPAAYDVPSLIHEVIQLVKLRFDSSLLEFKLHISENVPAALIGDELRIKQILNNLLTNAFKYTERGQIEFSVRAETGGGDEATLIFVVRDTGQGMTEEQISALFDRFTRFNLDKNRRVEGSGLGMNITYTLVNMMNGSIQVESRPGRGSVFTVRLPQRLHGAFAVLNREMVENLARTQIVNRMQVRQAQILRKYMPYGQVLVVDDTEANIYVAKLLLAPYGLKTHTAASGDEAIGLIRGGSAYDIIFMDHMMPKMDGIEAVKIIRGLGYSAPIIALTANAVAGQADMFLTNGFDDFISKPIDMRLLNVILNKYIHDRQTPEVLAAAALEKEKAAVPAMTVPAGPPARPAGGDTWPFDLPWLNAGRGLALFGGDLDTYLSALRAYIANVPDMINKLRLVTEETLPGYAIDVHGLKSASGWISADGLQASAANLEALAKAGDLFGLMTLNENFLNEIETFISDLRAQLAAYQP